MSDSSPAPETTRAVVRLGRHVEWSEGFWLGYVFTIEPPQAHILQARAGEALAGVGRRQRVLRPRTPQELEGALASILTDAAFGCTWIEAIRDRAAGSGAWTEAWIRLTLRMNERRELLRGGLEGGLVLVAHPDVKADIRRAGPDLWSIRTLLFELPPGPGVVVRGQSEVLVRFNDRTAGGTDLELLEQDLRRSVDTPEGVPAEVRARNLLQIAGRLRSVGRLDEALLATETAVDIHRNLAKARSDAFVADLASALNNLGICLSDLGRRKEALAATKEAVEIRRKLAKARPDAFVAVLANSLGVLAQIEAQRGDHQASLVSLSEALRTLAPIYRRLPGAFEALFGELQSMIKATCEAGGLELPADLRALVEHEGHANA